MCHGICTEIKRNAAIVSFKYLAFILTNNTFYLLAKTDFKCLTMLFHFVSSRNWNSAYVQRIVHGSQFHSPHCIAVDWESWGEMIRNVFHKRKISMERDLVIQLETENIDSSLALQTNLNRNCGKTNRTTIFSQYYLDLNAFVSNRSFTVDIPFS